MSDVYESPDGLFRVDFSCFEMRMSHWVCNPRVTHVPTGTVLLDLLGSRHPVDAAGVYVTGKDAAHV